MERTIHSFGTSAKNKKSILLRIAVVLMMMAWMVPAMAQTDYSGVYYIGSVGYTANNTTSNYYLCPTEGWCFYAHTNDFTGTDNGMPFLTTYQCRNGEYDASKAVWTIQKHPTEDYYYIIQRSTGKYLMGNGQIRTSDNADRMRVHLEEVSDPNNLDDKALFSIAPYSTYLVISCKSSDGWNDSDPDHPHHWLTVNGGNVQSLKGASGKTGGPTGYANTKGIVGIYTIDDANAKFYLEDYITRPTISYNLSNLIEITPAQTGTVTIKYTTNGTTPSATNGETYTDPFDVDDDVTIIKAVTIIGEDVSNVATFQPIVLLGSNHKRLIQSQNNAWNSSDFHFYMIPGDQDGNAKFRVNTTSLFRPSMEWYFLNAGVVDGTQYYYIVNPVSGKYLCWDGTDVCMDENNNNDNKFKFRIVQSPTAGTYNIIAYGLTSGNRFLNKSSANASANNIILHSSNTDANARWKFVLPSELDKNDPFTVSNPSTENYSYFKIASVGSSGYNIIPGTTNATTSNSNDPSIVNSMNWYFEVAQTAGNDDWLTYFYIRNAVTGDYLYFTKNANDQGACLVMCSTLDTITSGNEDRCLFTWAKTADANVNYYIIPKRLKNASQNQFSALQRDNATLKTKLTRSASNYAWTFPTSSYNCAQPNISWSDGYGGYVITATESDAKIYYKIGAGELTPSPETLYSGAISVADLDVESTTIRAIVARNSDGSDVSDEASATVYRVDAPQFILTEDGKVRITCDTVDVTIHYEIGTPGAVNTPTTNSTTYSGPIENAAGKVIKAIAEKGGLINSPVATSDVIKFYCATPVIRKTSNTTFTITCSLPSSGYHIRYNKGVDPDDPTPSSGTEYTGTVTFEESTLPFTVKAIAYADNYYPSTVATQLLTDDLQLDDDGYYIIADYEDYGKFVTMVNGDFDFAKAKYKIIDDIDVSAGVGVISEYSFSGELKGIAKADGSFPVVSNLRHAIFNTVNGGIVKNVMLDNVIISSGTNVGAICNEAIGASRIYNCGILATGSTANTDEKGYTTLSNCSSTIGGSGYVGSFVGLLDGSSRVINCFSYANITGGTKVGGIVGYNNVATTSNNLQTMVMNCMFYGDITGGTSKAPIYNGEIITNDGDADGVNNFNYFRMEAAYVQNQQIDNNAYNCALGAETRFLQRFEFFRHLLNSNRELASWWASTSTATVTKNEMLKWVMIPDSIGTSTPYPILKNAVDESGDAIFYPSVVNYTPSEEAIDENNEHRNEGRKLTNMGTDGKLSVKIQMGSQGSAPFGAPTGAALLSGQASTTINLTINDKDPAHFNFNYGKVQLPYYNDYGTKNYNGNRVVTGWKIVEITGGTTGSFITTGDDVTYDANGNITKMPYNFADRKCTNKDLYSTSNRVFNQGAYWDVPDGVTAITIEPYWAKCVYLADAYPDVVYKNDNADAMATASSVTTVGRAPYTNGDSYSINGENQKVYTSVGNARNALFPSAPANTHTVYDYAIVLVGNAHNIGISSSVSNIPYTLMSIDLDHDNEPDYSYIMRFNARVKVHPVRVDFINIPGLGMAQKTAGGTGTYNFGIMQPLGWFETTNTSLFRETQFEYDCNKDGNTRAAAPYILQGGVMEQWVLGQNQGCANNTTYFHVGGNVWFKEFHRGTHQDNQYAAKHPPVSVTGGEYEKFHLTGLYRADVNVYDDNAECYVTGGQFGVMAGTGMDGIGHPTNHTKGNITWVIDHADISEFYGGSFNAASPAQGNIHTIISDSHVDSLFCGGPKFGDMNTGRTVVTTATDCYFATFYGAGYGGNSYSRYPPFNYNNVMNIDWNRWVNGDMHVSGHDEGYEGFKHHYSSTYDGVDTQIDYQFIPMSSNIDNCARLWIEYVKFSLATTDNVNSTLKGCTVKRNFYGGGNLGKVGGNVVSILEDCTVKGNVFGAGYSATLPKVPVMNLGGFIKEPTYDLNLGAFLDAKFPNTVDYDWVHSDETINSTENAINEGNRILYTNESTTTLGTVVGNVTITLKGRTTVGKTGDNTTGNVFGGGDQSKVDGNTTVKIQGTPHILGNVYGGGNEGPVGGDSEVIIQDE